MQALSSLDSSLLLAIFFIFGLFFGSFISLVSYRLVHGGAIIVAHSRCPKCHHILKWLDLVPIFSWLFNKCKCRYCHTHISIRYPLTELFTGISFILCYLAYGLSIETLILCLITITLIILIVIDLEHKIIPDELQITLALLAIPYLYYWERSMTYALLMALALCTFSYGLRSIFWWWKKKEALGLGDVKFFAVAGLYLPLESFASFLFISGFSGVFLGILWRLMDWGERFPFGPSLAIAFFLCIAFPEATYQWLYVGRY